MQFDESMWVALGFVLFVILVWKKAGSALSETLDSRSAAIKAELDEARKLHEDALAAGAVPKAHRRCAILESAVCPGSSSRPASAHP